MNDPEAELLLAIQDRITDKVPEIKYTDQNLGQYLNEEFRKMMLFPCLLIDFPLTGFSGLQGNNQLGDATIVVTLFSDIWNNTNNLTPLEIKKEGLKYLDINQKVFEALQGWNPSFSNPFVRVQKKSHNDNEIGLVVKETTFSTTYEDYSCDDNTPRVQIGLRSE